MQLKRWSAEAMYDGIVNQQTNFKLESVRVFEIEMKIDT